MFRLCKGWGGRYIHPDYLLEDLTETQLQDWELFFEVEPWDGPAEDERAALAAWAAISPHSKKTRTKEEFLLQWGERDTLTPEEYRAKAQAVYRRAGGRK